MFPTYTSLGCCYKSLLPLKSLIFYLQLFVDIFTVLVNQLDYKQYIHETLLLFYRLMLEQFLTRIVVNVTHVHRPNTLKLNM